MRITHGSLPVRRQAYRKWPIINELQLTKKRRSDPSVALSADSEHHFFAPDQLLIAPEHLFFAPDQLSIAREHLFFSPDQLFIAPEHLFFPPDQLFIAP